jgi:hypothetical protein
VFRYDHDHHFTARFFQLGEEVIQLVEELLRANFVIRRFALAREVVAVMQRQGVVEGGVAGVTLFIFGFQPAVEGR